MQATTIAFRPSSFRTSVRELESDLPDERIEYKMDLPPRTLRSALVKLSQSKTSSVCAGSSRGSPSTVVRDVDESKDVRDLEKIGGV